MTILTIHESKLGKSGFIMPPFEEEGYIVLLMSVGRYVGRSVGRSVDQMVSDDYLKYHSSQSLHISHVDWSRQVDDSY